jgi:hypothetical protein
VLVANRRFYLAAQERAILASSKFGRIAILQILLCMLMGYNSRFASQIRVRYLTTRVGNVSDIYFDSYGAFELATKFLNEIFDFPFWIKVISAHIQQYEIRRSSFNFAWLRQHPLRRSLAHTLADNP